MVGEIRDLETAEIAMQASLTGHLVLSTLHTNDAPSALVRLIDMGIEPFLVASSLTIVLAQRLVRVICPQCREPYEASSAEKSYFTDALIPFTPSSPSRGEGKSGGASLLLYRGTGCNHCNDKGYVGRTGIFELLVIDNEIRPMITEKIDSQSIKNHAISRGMKTLRVDGLEKVIQGITTLEEVLRVTQKDYADISV
jgi:general secretion pathway protein E